MEGTTLKLIFILSLPLLSFSSIPKVNILVGKNLAKIRLRGTDIKRTYINKKERKLYKGLNTLSFNCKNKGELSNQNLLVYLKNPSQLIEWNDKKFLGNFIISSKKGEDSCNIIMQTNFEKYIALTLTKEMNAAWPKEALKAQAVAARSYAIYKMKHHKRSGSYFHLENSEKHQVHGSLEDESPNSIRAAQETQGQVLVSPSGKIQEIFYHAHCGGKTKTPDQVWGGFLEGYESVDCHYCQKFSQSKWERIIKVSKIKSAIKRINNKFHSLKGFLDPHLYAASIKFFSSSSDSIEISKPLLRKFTGRSLLPSANFQMQLQNDQLVVNGRGNGHSVGMCQMGALEMAKQGFNYKQILAHYFPQHRIVKLKNL